MQLRFISSAVLALLVNVSFAQTEPPSAPAPQQQAAPHAPEEAKFPPVSEANFTAAAPTRADVEGFLKTSWGYDTNRIWEVYSIEKTIAPGVSKVTVLLAQKHNPQIASLTFFVTPDGKHLITQDSVLDFGARPYENNYRILQQRATGPYRGAAAKQFELVEFADFECPHCREAQATAEHLVQDFPQARYVFENFPLIHVHPQAYTAAAYSVCVDQMGGNAAFFKFAGAIFEGQAELAGQDPTQALRNAATAAGQDPDKVTACVASPTAKATVDASERLAEDLNVNETPTLFIDGRAVPMLAVPYDDLKKIIEYQFAMDGAPAH
ncbi:MAG TPA: thioredoxin domain-containing protein [Acidobacteriaceae bacterium]|jgi:protein-disulfide isomerase|nr:thioredoxin domain-containing protein [Acidobacteriaceae bacterium]